MTSDWPPAEYRLPPDEALEVLAGVAGDVTRPTDIGTPRQLTLFEGVNQADDPAALEGVDQAGDDRQHFRDR